MIRDILTVMWKEWKEFIRLFVGEGKGRFVPLIFIAILLVFLYRAAIPEMLTQARGIIDSAMGKVFFEVLIPISALYFLFFVVSKRLFGLIEENLKIPGYEFERR